MRPTRLVLAALLTAAIVPGTWLRTAEPPQDFQRLATIEPIDVTQSQRGPFTLMAGWELTGDRAQFGGFSALVVLDKERFLAGSDTGRKLIFGRPDRSDLPGILSSFDDANDGPKESRDLESLAIDPSSGILWGGYEFREAIVRFDSAHRRNAEVRPPQMRNWESNGGAESLARLSDGVVSVCLRLACWHPCRAVEQPVWVAAVGTCIDECAVVVVRLLRWQGHPASTRWVGLRRRVQEQLVSWGRRAKDEERR